MRLNQLKYVFRVNGGKFLDFMLSNWGIKANLDKCKAVMEIRSPKTLKEV